MKKIINAQKKHIICIAGTNTDAGKTSITAGLVKALSELNIYPLVIKPIQTGCIKDDQENLIAPDIEVYKDAFKDVECETIFKFMPACSPHLAAKKADIPLDANSIAEQIKSIASHSGPTIVELAGGLMVPLNRFETNLDLIKYLGASVILVVNNKLGAINDALLSVNALKNDDIPITGFILNATSIKQEDDFLTDEIMADNLDIICQMSEQACLANISFNEKIISDDKEIRDKGWSELSAILSSVARHICDNFSLKSEDKSYSELVEYDKKHVWHPYSPAVSNKPRLLAKTTSACSITTHDGKELVDGVSSWWSAMHGYNNKYILEAIQHQARLMPHIMFGGFTHQPAIELTKKLLELTPQNLKHVFYSDSGSVSVEIALKMAILYQVNLGATEKAAFMSIRGGYHGDTLGAMGVCDPTDGMHTPFRKILPHAFFADRPSIPFDGEYAPRETAKLEAFFEAHSNETAAFILEPIMQGAGGMWFYHPNYLADISRLCKQHKILLIADEIATGFGRTGKMFACEWASCSPDIVCVGKGLTAGSIGMAATIISHEVAQVIAPEGKPFMHGPTFMANPLACAVANASLDLLTKEKYRDDPANPAFSLDWQASVLWIEKKLKDGFKGLKSSKITDIRVLGTIAAVEFKNEVDSQAAQEYFADEHSVWIRPFGRVIYLMPPYIIKEDELDRLINAVIAATAKF